MHKDKKFFSKTLKEFFFIAVQSCLSHCNTFRELENDHLYKLCGYKVKCLSLYRHHFNKFTGKEKKKKDENRNTSNLLKVAAWIQAVALLIEILSEVFFRHCWSFHQAVAFEFKFFMNKWAGFLCILTQHSFFQSLYMFSFVFIYLLNILFLFYLEGFIFL